MFDGTRSYIEGDIGKSVFWAWEEAVQNIDLSHCTKHELREIASLQRCGTDDQNLLLRINPKPIKSVVTGQQGFPKTTERNSKRTVWAVLHPFGDRTLLLGWCRGKTLLPEQIADEIGKGLELLRERLPA